MILSFLARGNAFPKGRDVEDASDLKRQGITEHSEDPPIPESVKQAARDGHSGQGQARIGRRMAFNSAAPILLPNSGPAARLNDDLSSFGLGLRRRGVWE